MSKINIMSLLLAGMFVAGLCCSQQVLAEDEETGNNLSLPVIWSDGVTKVLRGDDDEYLPIIGGAVGSAYVWYEQLFDENDLPILDDDGFPVYEKMTCSPVEGDCPNPLPEDAVEVLVYPQRDPVNTWQADSLFLNPAVLGTPPVDVTYVDWGDNLEAKDWYYRAIIRTETILHQDLSAEPDSPFALMTGYEMIHLFGLGVDEVWGTTLATYESDDATVYTGCARLTIQRLLVDPYEIITLERQAVDENGELKFDPVTGAPIMEEYDVRLPKTNLELGLTWNDDPYDPANLLYGQQWVGDVIVNDDDGEPYFQSVVWDATGSQDSAIYSAEINVKGKVIYGYNWDTGKLSDGPGFYRITFSMDANGNGGAIDLNAVFDTTEIMLTDEVDGGDEANNTTGGGIAVIDGANGLSYIDVELLEKKGGGGENGGGKTK